MASAPRPLARPRSYTMTKHFPHVKTYVRAHDINNAGKPAARA
jgi:hypothetical protein